MSAFLNWAQWIGGLAIIVFVAVKWVIPFIKNNPRLPFSTPTSRKEPTSSGTTVGSGGVGSVPTEPTAGGPKHKQQ